MVFSKFWELDIEISFGKVTFHPGSIPFRDKIGTWLLTAFQWWRKQSPLPPSEEKHLFTLIEKDTPTFHLVLISFIRAELSIHKFLDWLLSFLVTMYVF